MGVQHLEVKIQSDLKKLIGDRAEEAGLTMNEYVAKVFADLYEMPQLAKIPRMPLGRPRKKISAA